MNVSNNKRARKILRSGYIAISSLLIIGYSTGYAQEHPSEHPMEHPSSEKTSITNESLAEAISKYVTGDAKLKGGFFMVYDKEHGKALTLTLEKVHKDRLAALGNGVYFACADFNATDGNVYDLDIFMKDEPGGLEAADISIHKMNGKARYNWIEKDGTWTKSE